jgi:peptide/nickel transport system substrate-binding protein
VQAPQQETTLVLDQTAEPQSLDPLLITGDASEEVGSLIYSYLVRGNASGGLEPDLATSVPTIGNGGISRDGRTIVYHLRRGVTWQDGAPFTAADVIATYRAVMDPRNAVPTRLGFDRIVSMTARDPYTVRVRLRAAFAPFVTYFFETENYPILPAHLLQGPLKGSRFDAQPIGTGPFRVRAWKRGDSLQLDANPTYYGGAPKLAHLRIEFVPSAQTIAQRLQTGEADGYFNADASVVATLRGDRALRVTERPICGILTLLFQTRDPALRDPAVRRAIARAFDIGRDVPLATHDVLDARDAGRGLFTWAYVPARIAPSRAALPKALSLAIDTAHPANRTLALLFQEEARRAGMTLSIKSYAAQQFEATAEGAGPLASGNYQLALHQELTGIDPETSWLLACDQVPPTGYNVTRYCSRTVDAALRAALATSDVAVRKRGYAVVQRALAKDAPLVILAQLRAIEALPKTMTGFTPSLETPYVHAETWRL